jgi:hypothetical protein
MQKVFCALLEQGKNDAEAKSIIFNLEPFNHYPEYITNLREIC